MIFSKLFNKEISPYAVSDKVVFRNVDETLTLYVRSDAGSLVVGLKKAQEQLKTISDNNTEEERLAAAKAFACSVFGEEQAEKLAAFYKEPLAIISAVSIYFDRRLKKKIIEAQKK